MTVLTARALDLLLDGWREAPGVAAYTALADRIRLLVIDGRVALGTRLPAERDLAAHLGLSRTTVTAAYAALREAGYLESTRGSGSVARMPFREPLPEGSGEAAIADLSKACLPGSPIVPDALRRATELLPAFLGESGYDAFGLPGLRERLARHHTEHGLPTTPEQILVTLGAQHAIALLARTLLARGDRVLVENPGYPHGFSGLRAGGGRLLPVPVTSRDGWDVDELEQIIRRANPVLGYLMPDHHNPTGRTMDRALRAHVADLADRYGTQLVVDETMSGLTVGGAEPHPSFALDGPAILIGSVGKAVWGGIRVGWVRADPRTIQRMARARFAGDLGTPVLEQLMLQVLLDDWDRILADRRAYLTAAHARTAASVAERFPDWEVPRIDGGLSLWVNLGLPVSSQLTLAARNEGLVLGAGPSFGVDGAFERFLRIPFSHPADETERALDLLQRAWNQVVRRPLPVAEELMPAVV